MANFTQISFALLVLILALMAGTAFCRPTATATSTANKKVAQQKQQPEPSQSPNEQAETKQLFLLGAGKETSTPDFVRLVVMRLIYGLASTMGLEERLDGVLNGAFAPPNADDGIFSFGGSYDDADDGDLGVLFDDL